MIARRMNTKELSLRVRSLCIHLPCNREGRPFAGHPAPFLARDFVTCHRNETQSFGWERGTSEATQRLVQVHVELVRCRCLCRAQARPCMHSNHTLDRPGRAPLTPKGRRLVPVAGYDIASREGCWLAGKGCSLLITRQINAKRALPRSPLILYLLALQSRGKTPSRPPSTLLGSQTRNPSPERNAVLWV